MELFAGMADMLSEGLPLSFLFVVTNAEAPPYTKETLLINWMEGLKSRGISPEFTHSDKDQSEINALNQVWPTAKHQLCLWHMLRALKRRLANNREPPAFYGLEDAKKIFAFIDPTFVPLRQMSTKDKVYIQSILRVYGQPRLPIVGNHPIPPRKAQIPNPAPPPRPSPSIYTGCYPESRC